MGVACRFLAWRAILGRVVRQPDVASDAAGAVRRSLAVRTLAARRSGGRDLRSRRAAVAAPNVVVGAVPRFLGHFGRTPGDQVRKLIAFAAYGSYRLDLRYFEYHRSARATGDAFVRTGNTSFPPSPTSMARPVYRHRLPGHG